MVGLLGLVFALRYATLPGLDPGAVFPAREEARIVAEAASSTAEQVRMNELMGGISSTRQNSLASTVPFHHRYRPREWVALMADRLNMRDTGVTHMALWIASWPLRLDASDTRVYVQVTLRVP